MLICRVDLGSWLLRILTWDTALPACVAFTPVALEYLFPNRRALVELIAVLLPIAAFFTRLRAGRRHIASNRCSAAVKRFQFLVFCLGILPLVLVDCVLILSGLMPKGMLFATATDRLVWVVLLSTYLTLMAIAMFPGRVDPSHEDAEDLDSPPEWWSADV